MRLVLLLTILASVAPAQIIQKNAGPADASLRFDLPPPEPLSAQQAVAALQVAPGYTVDLIAAEPAIQAPVAMSFDSQGRLYVVEMRGYCHDMSYVSEKDPTGRVSRLEDADGDGSFERHTVFLDQLILPRAVLAYGKGALIAAPPQLIFAEDLDGDGVAEKQTVVASDYGKQGGQPEHMANGLLLGLDNWIWSANHTKRYKQTASGWISDAVPQIGQWGLSQDDSGRLYFNYNSSLAHSSLLPPTYLRRNMRYQPESLNRKVATKQDVYPTHPTPGVNRGYMEKTLRKDGSLTSATAVCSPWIYRAEFMPELRQKLLVCEPAGNLIAQLSLTEKEGIVEGTPLKENLLSSKDERFRPVSLATGLEGAIYVADMARGVIQHPGFVTHYLLKNIEARKLFPPVNLGRIYRIRPLNKPLPKLPHLAATTEGLRSANGVVRDLTQQQLIQKAAQSEVPALTELLRSSAPAVTRLHAMWTLEGLSALKTEHLLAALADPAPELRRAAVQLSGPAQLSTLTSMTQEQDARTRLHLLATLAALPGTESSVATLAQSLAKHPATADAIVTALMGRELEFLTTTLRSPAPLPEPVVKALASCVLRERRSSRLSSLLDLANDSTLPERSRIALLEGLVPKSSSKTPTRLIYLAEQPALMRDVASQKGKLGSALSSLDKAVAWPGKPGVPPPPVIPPLTAEQQALFDHGKVIYTGLCAACHQPHGLGMEGLAPPLADSEWVLGNPERLARIVLHGLSGSVKVSGRTWKLEMPPLGVLQDKDIAGVLTYLRREWEHGASPVSLEDITRQRAKDAGRTTLWTEKELLAHGK